MRLGRLRKRQECNQSAVMHGDCNATIAVARSRCSNIPRELLQPVSDYVAAVTHQVVVNTARLKCLISIIGENIAFVSSIRFQKPQVSTKDSIAEQRK